MKKIITIMLIFQLILTGTVWAETIESQTESEYRDLMELELKPITDELIKKNFRFIIWEDGGNIIAEY